MSARRLKAQLSRSVYKQPPTPEVTQDDYYLARARKALTDHSRHQLEVLVSDWVEQEAATVLDDNQRWQARRLEHHGRHIIPGDHHQQWPWSARTRTTSTYFVPLNYGHNQRLTVRRGQSAYALAGLCLRVTEHRDLLWKPAQIATPPWFELESDAALDVLLIWNQRHVQPLRRRFARVLVEHLPDQTLAAIYKSCL